MRMGEIGRAIGRTILDSVGRTAGHIQETKPLPVDLLESDDAYLAIFDAPGATGSDVQVRFLDGSVLVRIDRFRSYHEGFEMRFPGRGLSLDGSVQLPEDAQVDADAATATLRENGTLEVHVPKEAADAAPEPAEDAASSDDSTSPSDDAMPAGG